MNKAASTPETANAWFPELFSSIDIGARRAKNRIMRVATTANLADGNRVGPRVLAFYRELAAGGVGTIVTEALRTQPHDPFGPGALVIFDRDAIDGLRQIADACHSHGALLIGQLNMGGRQHLASRVIPYAVAPSAIACPRSGGVPHELTAREIEDTIETYVSCAVHCIEAGMDGVEIHGAQGHLIQQFVSPYTNRREDDWGGTAEKRLRFATEILKRTRTRIGRGIVGYRMGVEEFTDSGLGIDDTVAIAQQFVADGLIDYLSLSQGNFNSIETHLPDRHEPVLAYRSLHARFKQACGNQVPVVASTRMPGPEQAEAVIAAGEADMVGLCRPLIVDPQWPAKARRGRSEEIRRCIACNQCWAWIGAGEPIACATNPEAGRAHLWPKLARDRAEFSRRVVIVGAGPAGLEAARVCRARGHQVTVLERDAQPGGRLKRVHEVPFFEEMKNLLDYLVPQVADADIRYNTPASVELLESMQADDIIIATGAEPMVPELSQDGSVQVTVSDGPIELAQSAAGDHIVIMDEDGYYWTSMLIESAIALGKKPIVVSRFFEICRELPMVSRINLLRQLDRHQGRAIANSLVAGVADGQVAVAHYLTGRVQQLDNIAAVIWAGAARARAELAEQLIANGASKNHVHVIGDAFAPRRLAQALGEAHALARRIGSPART